MAASNAPGGISAKPRGNTARSRMRLTLVHLYRLASIDTRTTTWKRSHVGCGPTQSDYSDKHPMWIQTTDTIGGCSRPRRGGLPTLLPLGQVPNRADAVGSQGAMKSPVRSYSCMRRTDESTILVRGV